MHEYKHRSEYVLKEVRLEGKLKVNKAKTLSTQAIYGQSMRNQENPGHVQALIETTSKYTCYNIIHAILLQTDDVDTAADEDDSILTQDFNQLNYLKTNKRNLFYKKT